MAGLLHNRFPINRLLLFVFPILVITTISFIVFGVFQVRYDQERLLDDLKRKTSQIAEGMELSVQRALESHDLKSANYLAERFERRERLQGCVIYNAEGEMLAVTNRIAEWKEIHRPYIDQVLQNLQPRGSLEKFKDYTVYSYVMPILNDRNTMIGLIEIVHDTAYVFNRLTVLWRRISVTLILLISLIFIMSIYLQSWIYVMPVKRLTEWFRRFQKGETNERFPAAASEDEFGTLATEVEQVALNLRVARRSIAKEATERLRKEDIWSESKVRDLIHAKIGETPLFVVTNREPYMHVTMTDTTAARCVRPASGVVTALHPILCASGGLWVAHGSGNADKRFVNAKDKLGVPPADNRYILKRIWLTKEEEQGYYYGFSNEGLWPLCHNTHTRPVFKRSDWEMYCKVNARFAQSIADELPVEKPFIFIQDYHFTILPRLLKEMRPDAKIVLFWHIPWPTPEAFQICPYYKEILHGMLGCDLIGFHVQSHCNNFLDTVNRLLESRVDTEHFSVFVDGKETFVKPFPISVDPAEMRIGIPQTERVAALRKELGTEAMIVAVGVDRIDYTKGILEKILAVDRFLEKYPRYLKKFVLVQIASPSRTHIKRYHDLMNEIDELVEKVNWKHLDGDWKPIMYLKKHFSQEEIAPYYAIGDMCIVSALHDGMNLVAKEYICTKQGEDGVLLLSKFTGASRELTDALIINPYSIEEFSENIRAAVEMPVPEKKTRMNRMYLHIKDHNIYKWAADIINEALIVRNG